VQAVNRKVRTQFTRDYPVDILFQDQCGARTWLYDRNAASPTPYAYAEGLLSQVDEDAAVVPLSTEDGFDRVVNGEVQLCGFTFPLVPGQNPEWARPFRSLYPPGTWEIFPVVQVIAHDKAALLHHDLGKFVVDRSSLSWTLGLGFAMSARTHATALKSPRTLHWLRWLDRIQKSVCARYVGEPLRSFAHEPGGGASQDDGVLRAAYGPVRVVANLGPNPRDEGGRQLAGHGFLAEAPGMIAGNLARFGNRDFSPDGVSFVTEGDARSAEIWVLARSGAEAAALLPGASSGAVTLTVDRQPPRLAEVRDGAVRFTVSPADATVPQLVHARITAP
jgi:hypothetical protein